MKNISKSLFLSFTLALFLCSCEKDEVKDYFEGGTNPQLTASVTALDLSFDKADQTALILSWTNPEYKFTTGVSSQDVSYIIDIDTAGANFTNPKKQSIAISQDLSRSFIVSEFNDYLLNQLVLVPGMSHNLEIRVTSKLGSNAIPLISNVIALTATPYAIPPKVKPPVNGELFLVGDATHGGWNNPVPVPAQQFTRISETLFEITVPLYGGKHYLMLPVNGDWSHKYAVKDQSIEGLGDNGGDFFYDAAKDIPGPSLDGTYKITVDFQRGKFTVTK